MNVSDKQGTDKSDTIIWHHNWGKNNLANFQFAPNGDEVNNYAVAVNPGGPRSSTDFTSRAGSHNPNSWKEYGILGAWITAGQVDPLPVLQAAADAQVEAYAWPLQAITVYPKRQGDLKSDVLYRYMDDYIVGDVISASVRKGAFRMRGEGRVTQVILKQVAADNGGSTREVQEEVLLIPEPGESEAQAGDDLSGLDGG